MVSFKLERSSIRGKVLCDRYYLHDMIAQSNYSRIFLATDLAVNARQCAIKQLHPDYCSTEIEPEIEAAFLQEVEISKKIAGKHVRVCQFYDYFVDSGNKYLAQEWIEGTTLEQKLSYQPKLSESETKTILSSILQILERIHSLGVVHNDVKPSNIILRLKDKLPVLIDFGIARKANTEYEPKTIVGTPGYMSLEQAMGKVDFNNDLHSLGLTAIHLLTGISPLSIDFESNPNNFWNREKTAFDPQLVTTIDRAISPYPNRRFSSAKEMFAVLHSLNKQTSFKSTKCDRAKSKLLLFYGSSFIMALAVFSTWLYFNRVKPLPETNSSADITDSYEDNFLDKDNLSSTPVIEDKKQPTISSTLNAKNNQLKKVIFTPGTSENTILENLGEPLWRKPGFWANSVAWSYEDIVSEGFDIGYIFNSQTNKLRQAEIAVPPQTDLTTVQTAMNSFLATESSTVHIELGLQAVYQRKKETYNFATGNLEGIIKRNQQDRIYLAVWEADFH